MDDFLKDALDAARYTQRQTPSDNLSQALPCHLGEDEEGLETFRDKWSRLVILKHGKVVYYEGKGKE